MLFKRRLKSSPDLANAEFHPERGDWFGDGFKETAGLIELPVKHQQVIYDLVQPILEYGDTPEKAWQAMREQVHLIEKARSWGGGTDRQTALAFLEEVCSRAAKIRIYRDWQRRSIAAAKRNTTIYGRLRVIDGRDHGICSELHGIILPFGHRWWGTHYPPHRIGCRCSIIATTDRSLKQRGQKVTLDEDLPWLIETRVPGPLPNS